MDRDSGAVQRGALVERFDELPPHGQILTLCPQIRDRALHPDAVLGALRQYMEQVTPFTGLLVDLMPGPYDFSESDLTAVLATIAAWRRGWVIPAAVVLAEPAASELQNMLDITKLNQVRQLRVVATLEAGLMHIREMLSQRARGGSS